MFVSALSGCASTPTVGADASSSSFGIFWEIRKGDDTPPSYLFGTIHSEDPRVLTLPAPVEAAFESAQMLALEIELNQDAAGYAAQSMFYSDGQTLHQVAGGALFDKAVIAMAAKGVQREQMLYMKPWAVFTMLNMPEANTGLFLDVTLYQRMKQKGRAAVGLETIAEQVATLDEMPLSAQLELLADTLEHGDELDRLMDETIEIYLSRDLAKIEALNSQFLKDVSPTTAAVFTDRLLVNRNQRMLQRMLPLLNNGNTFIAVGALHLPGEKGLLSLLKKSGFHIRSLY